MRLQSYADPDGNSGIRATAITVDDPATRNQIIVLFKDGSSYLYYETSVGRENFREMCELARAGDGLNSFIDLTPDVYNGYS